MATTDSNGIVRVEASDDVAPLHTVLNSLAQSVSNAFNAETRIYPVANAAGRTAKVTEIGAGNISASRPLFVWRANAPTGRNLEYTVNGSTWLYYSSSADVIDTGWSTLQGGTSSQPTVHIRREGKTSHIVIDGFMPLPSGATTTVLAAGVIPTQYRPTITNVRAAVSIDARPAIAIVGTNGSLNVVNHTGAARSAFNGSLISYPVD